MEHRSRSPLGRDFGFGQPQQADFQRSNASFEFFGRTASIYFLIRRSKKDSTAHTKKPKLQNKLQNKGCLAKSFAPEIPATHHLLLDSEPLETGQPRQPSSSSRSTSSPYCCSANRNVGPPLRHLRRIRSSRHRRLQIESSPKLKTLKIPTTSTMVLVGAYRNSSNSTGDSLRDYRDVFAKCELKYFQRDAIDVKLFPFCPFRHAVGSW